LLYSAFCVSTARLLAGTAPRQTAQSEQRQDTDVTADLLRTGWGRLLLIGFFILKAAVLSSATQAKGLDAVFRSVASSAYGVWLLALLASGLVCYGLYCLVEARYRDLTPGR
jgi:hypothetical protein